MSSLEKFFFSTSDGIRIFGIKNSPQSVKAGILCLHMMPATKESYEPFMKKAESHGWLVYAIDFRGHGESTNNGALDYQQFTSEEHKKYKIEAYEAYRQLQSEAPVVGIVGASIGANFAAILQQENEVPKSVLLSAGLNYYGVQPLESVKTLKPTQSILYLASEGDQRASGNCSTMARQLFDQTSTPNKEIEIYKGSAHGTDLLTEDPDRLEQVIAFLAKEIRQTA